MNVYVGDAGRNMCFKSASWEFIVRQRPDSNNMLPLRSPNCVCAEEGAAGVPLRFQMRLHRTLRVISVALVLLLGVALATLVLLLFGSPALLRHGKPPAMSNALTAPQAVSEKLQSENHLSHPSAMLTIEKKSHLVWQYAEGNAHRRGGMTYEGGSLTVPSKGLYRLYLQVTFVFTLDNNDSDMCANDILDLKIKLERYSNSYNNFTLLLESDETMSCKHDWTKSMYTSGIFELEALSQIRVNLTPENLVKTDDAHSFLGAEQILAY